MRLGTINLKLLVGKTHGQLVWTERTVFIDTVWRMECGLLGFQMLEARAREIAFDTKMSAADVIEQLYSVCRGAVSSRADIGRLEEMYFSAHSSLVTSHKRARTVPSHIGKIVRRCFELTDKDSGHKFKVALDGTIIKKWEADSTTDRKPLWSVKYESTYETNGTHTYALEEDEEDLEEAEVLQALKASAMDMEAKDMEPVQMPPLGSVSNAIDVDVDAGEGSHVSPAAITGAAATGSVDMGAVTTGTALAGSSGIAGPSTNASSSAAGTHIKGTQMRGYTCIDCKMLYKGNASFEGPRCTECAKNAGVWRQRGGGKGGYVPTRP